MLSDEELLRFAGQAAYTRGRSYFSQGRVELSHCESEWLAGSAYGSEVYALNLRRQGANWTWRCDCPAADGGVFCKHLVAAVMTARHELELDGPEVAEPDIRVAANAAKKASPRTVAVPMQNLQGFLRAQPAERLAGWLEGFADRIPEVRAALSLRIAAQDPKVLKTQLSRMLRGKQLDYFDSRRFAQRLQPGLVALSEQLARDAQACRALCEFVLERLLDIYGESDDSSGDIGAQLREVVALHVQACTLAPPGKALVKPLLALQEQDAWSLLSLSPYWASLGADGQHAYGQIVMRRWAIEVERGNPKDLSVQGIFARDLVVAYAHCAGDGELLLRALRWSLAYERDYLRLSKALGDLGREREQTALLEEAVRRFPKVAKMREALAACLESSGLHEEALEKRWEAFCLRPDNDSWDALKQASGSLWPQWRERALQKAADSKRGKDRSDAVSLLIHDGDLVGAASLAQNHGVEPRTLEHLADLVQSSAPAAAGEFYWRVAQARLGALNLNAGMYTGIASLLQKMARLLSPEAGLARIADVRVRYGRKHKLMEALRQHGL